MTAPSPRRETPIAWVYGGAALLALAAFVSGNVAGRRSPAPAADQAPLTADAGQVPLQAGASAAPDISAMSPEERATRLFNRVMLYTEQGKADSAKFFAPMAISAYEMMPADAHNQYDIGVISAAVGDVARARAESDTILAARPTHLLGLVLAIKAAVLGKNQADVTRYGARLVAAAPSERAGGLKEYAEHSRDIDDALAKASRQ
ncbi:MAG: hypothetical protein ABJE47_20330 [bacterium]